MCDVSCDASIAYMTANIAIHKFTAGPNSSTNFGPLYYMYTFFICWPILLALAISFPGKKTFLFDNMCACI